MIEKLHLKNFTCFADNEFEFSEGINVFIGENGTGKTHLLKVLLWAGMSYGRKDDVSKDDVSNSLKAFKDAELINEIFKSKNSFLLRNKENVAIIEALIDGQEVPLTLDSSSYRTKKIDKPEKMKFLFIPSKEILSFFDGFLALYNRREVSFDATYQMLAESLDLPKLKHEYAKELGLFEFIAELRDILQADVIQENGRFYLKTENDKTEINLVAEGWRKIATLIYLILNGELELNKNMVLLIDEPEANLNPKLIGVMAKFLVKLANKGVQVFVATHSYLLSNYLSLYSEYRAMRKKEEQIPDIKFFALSKSTEGIEVEEADAFAKLSSNSIMDEYAHYINVENQLIIQQMRAK